MPGKTMTRTEERAHLAALIEDVGMFGLNHQERTRLITRLLDGGYRYNPTVLREAAKALQGTDPGNPVQWLQRRATTMEDTL